ncbi:MAG: hypothetical protein GXY44_14710 [Phycisphaerales bacterium]|nr:hypothetical protein [Phycisphaerales bacterium]
MNIRPVSRKGCCGVRFVLLFGKFAEGRSVWLRGVIADRFGAVPSVFGATLGLPPVREGERESEGGLLDGLRLFKALFRVSVGDPVLGLRSLSGLLETPASPAEDRALVEGAG